MKNAIRKGVLMAAALLTASAFGQTTYMRVNIPFDFHAGSKVLPAGEYHINVNALAQRVELRQVDGSAGMFLGARPEMAAETAMGAAVFHQYGNTYLLRTIRSGGSSWAYEIPATNVERELASTNGLPKLTMVRAGR